VAGAQAPHSNQDVSAARKHVTVRRCPVRSCCAATCGMLLWPSPLRCADCQLPPPPMPAARGAGADRHTFCFFCTRLLASTLQHRIQQQRQSRCHESVTPAGCLHHSPHRLAATAASEQQQSRPPHGTPHTTATRHSPQLPHKRQLTTPSHAPQRRPAHCWPHSAAAPGRHLRLDGEATIAGVW
jgi:hypothetical protein